MYSPGYATVRSDPVIVEIAEKYKVTPTQVILAWHVSRGVHAVPCSKNPKHQAENIDVSRMLYLRATFMTDATLQLPTLDAEDLKRISALDKNQRLCNVPDEKGLVGGWTLEQLGW